VERIATEYKVSPRTVERAGDFVEGLDALKEIREDLPKSVVTKRSHQATQGQGKAKVTKARVSECNTNRVCNLRGSAAWNDVF
jgi:hypothetical protein